MSNELARTDSAELSYQEILQLGKVFYASGLFSDLKSEAQAIVKILAGKENGIAPFAAINGIHIIQNKPSFGAGIMAAKVKGSARYDYRVNEHSDTRCSIDYFERIDGKLQLLGNSTFTIEDARKAQTQNLNKFPRNMLFARAMSNGVKWYVPDVFTTAVYTPEEMGATVDGEGNVVHNDETRWKLSREYQEVVDSMTPDFTPDFSDVPTGELIELIKQTPTEPAYSLMLAELDKRQKAAPMPVESPATGQRAALKALGAACTERHLDTSKNSKEARLKASSDFFSRRIESWKTLSDDDSEALRLAIVNGYVKWDKPPKDLQTAVAEKGEAAKANSDAEGEALFDADAPTKNELLERAGLVAPKHSRDTVAA
jgi:hypothetical protein